MKKKIYVGWILIAVLLLGILGFYGVYKRQVVSEVVLNEVCAHNTTTLKQKYYGSADYIELYNAGSEAIDLSGYQIAKNREGKNAFTFQDCEIPAGGYVIVFASGEVPDTGENIFAPFRISDEDTLYLSNAEHTLIDCVTLPKTVSDVAYVRESDGASNWTTRQGSPWSKNEAARSINMPGDVSSPQFSLQSGFYDQAITLELQSKEGQVYYTLDCSEPDESSLKYTQPLLLQDASAQENQYCNRTDFSTVPYEVPKEKVDKAVIVRAVTINEKGERSPVVTGTYFIGKHFKDTYRNWKVVSVVAEPEDLFGGDGMYVLGNLNAAYREEVAMGYEEKEIEPANYLRHGTAAERESQVEIFDGNQTLALKQTVGLNLNGNGSRLNPQKSFRITAREKYDGSDRIQYNDFYQNCLPESLVIRYGFTQNQWLTDLVKEKKVAVQGYQPCALFLEGEYWGIYCIQERCTESYLENHFGVSADQIVLVRNGDITVNTWDANYAAYEEKYLQFRDNITRWYESGEDCYEKIEGQMDIDSYIDYLSIQMYIGNCDFSDSVNMAMWRTAEV